MTGPARDDPLIQAWLDQMDSQVAQTIRRSGQAVEYVFGCETGQPSFAYTIGLFGLGHTELLVFSLDPADSAGVLNQLAGQIRGGRNLVPGEEVEIDGWPHRMVIEDVPNPGDIVFAANRHYQRPGAYSVPVFQLTYDDQQGRFPWDAGYSLPTWIQPRPGTFVA